MSNFTVDLHFLLLLYILAIACSAIFAGACMEYRQQGVVRSYLAIMILYIGWLAGNLFLLLAPDFHQKVVFAHSRIIILTLIPPCWVYFSKELFRVPGEQLSSKYLPALFIVPAGVIIASLVGGSTLLFHDIQPFVAFGIPTLQWSAGPLLKIHLLYSYALLVVACYYCIRGLKYQRGTKLRYGFLLLFSLLAFAVVEGTGILLVPEIRFLGIPALTQVLSSIAFYYILHRQQVVRSFSQNNHVLFESLPMPVILSDGQEKVVLYNSRARDLFFFNVSSAGSKLRDILPKQIIQDLPPLDSVDKGLIVSLNDNENDLQSTRYFEVISEAFSHESLYREGRLLIFKEVTELKKTTQTNQRLMSLMSHDLLGNLSSLEMLSRNKSESYWDLVADTAKSSVDLLKNILLWSSTQGNFYQPNRELLPAKELIQSCLQQFQVIAEARHVTLNLIESSEEIHLNVDVKMFAAILRNILSNAIKHSPTRSTIDIEYMNSAGDTLVRVTDRGPGIDKDTVKEIFNHVADKPIARDSSSEGYGIGLFLIQHFLKLHGGRLEISSLPTGGCTVTAFFPA